MKNKSKIIVILGPTASGKSELAVRLAKKFNGEVISADSRQVYKGLNIGSGKITPDTKNSSNFSTGQVKKKCIFTHKGIPHYCIDVASPKRKYTVVQYKKAALEAIEKIQKKGEKGEEKGEREKGEKREGGAKGSPRPGGNEQSRIPILCGGTGFYIQAIVDGLIIPEVKPDWQLRKNLEKKTTEELFEKLKNLDPSRAKTIDPNNRRRLIRALEIVIKTGKPIPELKKEKSKFNVLMIGVKKSAEELKKLITKRLVKRIKQGMITEVRNLKKPARRGGTGLSWARLESFGLEYRWLARYLQNKIPYHQMLEKIQTESEQLAKKQRKWFNKDKRVKWVKNYQQAEKLVKLFLK